MKRSDPDSSCAFEETAVLRPCEGYFWRSLPLHKRTGSEVFATLFQPQTARSGPAGIATLLESPDPSPAISAAAIRQKNGFPAALSRYSICAGAPRTVKGDVQMWTPKIGDILPLLQQMERTLSPENNFDRSAFDPASEQPHDDLPYLGGWLGWLGYDFAWEIEQLPWLKEDKLPFPVAFWYEPAEFAVLDHPLQRLWLAAETSAGLASMSERVSRQADDRQIHLGNGVSASAIAPSWETRSLVFETEQAEFEQAVRRAKSHIRAGDVFQVNHSLRFQAQTTAPSWEVYKTLHQINPSPFASYWHTPWGSVVSCSPERLVHLRSGVAQSRPIAGTRPRGRTVIEDRAIAQELQRDPKELAEHIMLVDLARNDLGRVCKWGSVRVAELMTLERYSHVMHLVSNVIGGLPAEPSAAHLIAAMFPGGTITGCPKVRCMEIIEALEPVRRSLFYGSCGYFDRRGQLDLNILIRTLLMTLPGGAVQTVWGQVGAGIVADSNPEQEWRESLQKAKAQLSALGL